MSDTSTALRDERHLPVGRFIAGLERLAPPLPPEKDRTRAERAALRRGLGKPPGEAKEMWPVVIPLLPPVELLQWHEQTAYTVASLFALHPLSWGGERRGPLASNLGASLRLLDAQRESGGPQRRFVALLNSDTEALPEHLRHIVSLLRVGDPAIPVDWGRLTWDLLDWEKPGRRVQRRWATAFYGGRTEEPPADSPDEGGANPK